MRKFNILFLVLIFTNLLALTPDAISRIDKYAGKNSKKFLNLLETSSGETKEYLDFILENCAPNDLAMLTPEYLSENIEYALKTKDLSYANQYDEDIFLHFVLPHRISQEPLENWRPVFYEEILPRISEETDIMKAAILVNLWAYENMTFKPTHGRDQAPLTTIKRGFARCEESMIILIAALRSVGIPARPASAPFWNFTDNNHAWVEVWTPEGWKYMGEPENDLNRAWFTKTTQRSTLIQAQAFGDYDSPNSIKQENHATILSSIQFYTDYTKCKISVTHKSIPIAEANIVIYAASYGGLMPMQTLKTDEYGVCTIPLGKGTVWVTAGKDSLFAANKFDLMHEDKLVLELSDDYNIDKKFQFHFPLAEQNQGKPEWGELLGDKFYLMRDNVNLKRKNRLSSYQQSEKFVRFYDRVYNYDVTDKYANERESFLEKTNTLAANTDDWLHCLKINQQPTREKIYLEMIKTWDTKELCEIADSTMIEQVADIYLESKNYYQNQISDSLFYENVLAFTWRSATPPQNGWQPKLYSIIENLRDKDLTITTNNVLNWVDESVIIDEDYYWNYFSGAMNPLNILTQKNIPETYRIRLINSTLKLLGVPVRWSGRLEYFDGVEFVNLPQKQIEQKKDKPEDHLAKLRVSIFVDDQQVQAEPWSNFLLAVLDKDTGSINTAFMQGEADSLDYVAEYRTTGSDNIYLESFVRNSNGDCDIVVKRINGLANIKIELSTPKEYLDYTDFWSNKTIENCKKQVSGNSGKYQLLMVRGKRANEPEIRILEQLEQKLEELKDKHCVFTIYSENRKHAKKKIKSALYITGDKIISDPVEDVDYPVIFIFDAEQNIIFSAIGYDMGLPQLILKKIQ